MITSLDIAWAAGFIEGEGCFSSSGRGGTFINVKQVQREPLERLLRMFGGKITIKKMPSGKPINSWTAYGNLAAGVAMTVFVLLSPRRTSQALAMLNKWKSAPGHRNLQKTHCPQGHPYVEGNMYFRGEWRICRTCAIARVKARHLRKKSSVITNS